MVQMNLINLRQWFYRSPNQYTNIVGGQKGVILFLQTYKNCGRNLDQVHFLFIPKADTVDEIVIY